MGIWTIESKKMSESKKNPGEQLLENLSELTIQVQALTTIIATFSRQMTQIERHMIFMNKMLYIREKNKPGKAGGLSSLIEKGMDFYFKKK